MLFRTIELTTDLSVDDCVRRLRAEMNDSGPVRGSVSADSLTLRKNNLNRASTYLFGEFASDGDKGTVIRCFFSLHPLMLVFGAVWLVIWAIGFVGEVSGAIRNKNADTLGLVMLCLVPVLLLGLGWALSRRVVGSAALYLEQFLCATLNAKRRSPSVEGASVAHLAG